MSWSLGYRYPPELSVMTLHAALGGFGRHVVGLTLGENVGNTVGEAVGWRVGELLGEYVGNAVGT